MNLDLLKTCTTNVCVVERAFEAQYAFYTSLVDASSNEGLHSIVASLRSRNIICTAEESGLWVFMVDSDQSLAPASHVEQEESLTLEHEGLLGLQMEENTNLGDIFMRAIEATIAYNLAKDYAMIHIGPWQWLSGALNSGSGDEERCSRRLIELHVNLTESGSLYVSVASGTSSLRPVTSISDPASEGLVLAPSGTKAVLPGKDDLGDVEISTSAHSTTGTIWKTRVSEALKAEGITMEAGMEWITVQLCNTDTTATFSWPAPLCFISAKSGRVGTPGDWKMWFDQPGDSAETYTDPVASAQDWYSAVSQLASAAEDQVDYADVLPQDMPISEAIVAETPMATSSPYNQRVVDHQAAMAGIYPTPPDGFLPQQSVAMNSSEAHDLNMQADPSTDPTVPVHESELPSEDALDRSMSIESAQDTQAYHQHSDDLFGDMNEMDFNANEIGDADFDYFDEPDDIPGVTGATPDGMEIEGIIHVDGPLTLADRHRDFVETVGKEFQGTPDQVSASPSANATPAAQAEATYGSSSDAARLSSDAIPEHTQSRHVLEKPLSPFSIRERFVPKPVPASTISRGTIKAGDERRNSTFDPMPFSDNPIRPDGYASIPDSSSKTILPAVSNIGLPFGSGKAHVRRSSGSAESSETSEDEEDSSSLTSLSDVEELPPKVPWVTKKRKRASLFEELPSLMHVDQATLESDENTDDIVDLENVRSALRSVLLPANAGQIPPSIKTSSGRQTESAHQTANARLLELSKQDLIAVAQIVCEQANTTSLAICAAHCTAGNFPSSESWNVETTDQQVLVDALERIFPDLVKCRLAEVVREFPPRTGTNPAKATQMGQPRVLQREGSMPSGPDCVNLSPPYVRVQRGSDLLDVLPPAIDFWGALGLGPANGPKDVTAIGICPWHPDLIDLQHEFLQDLGSTYEGLKLGTLQTNPGLEGCDELDLSYENGIAKVPCPDAPVSWHTAIESYESTCVKLGRALEPYGREVPQRTIVICMLDPFEDNHATQYLCACFWRLFSSYRKAAPREHSNTSRCDLVLRLIPVSLLASPDGMVILSSQQRSALATEVYDCCPPSPHAAASIDPGGALSIVTAPAIELALIPPRPHLRFQLTSDPPSNLLQEPSVLHLAYALTSDGQWLIICWLDSTGRYYMPWTICLRGQSFRAAAGEVWERTMEIISARTVTWRLFIVSNTAVDASKQRCWQRLAASRKSKQVLHVYLLSVDDEPVFQVRSPAAAKFEPSGNFLTPVTTPQPNSMTASPDANGQSANLPPTPALSDFSTAHNENDPDAHLVDLGDESWGMLLPPAVLDHNDFSTASDAKADIPTLAKGMLLRRGCARSSDTVAPLEGLGVNVHWDIRVRPGGYVDEWPAEKAETTLRESLRMYRSLALLSRLKRLDYEYEGAERRKKGTLPLHLLSVTRAARALDGYLCTGS